MRELAPRSGERRDRRDTALRCHEGLRRLLPILDQNTAHPPTNSAEEPHLFRSGLPTTGPYTSVMEMIAVTPNIINRMIFHISEAF